MPARPNASVSSPRAPLVPRAFAIVPAAGESRRMGTAKLLLPWGDSTVIQSVIAAWQKSRVDEVLVVVSPQNEALAATCRDAGATVVVPATPPADMKASIQAAVAGLLEGAPLGRNDCILIAPADMPWLEPATIDRILNEFDSASGEIVIPTHAARRGHPIVIPWSLAEEVQRLGEHDTLKTVIERHRPRIVECDATVLGDLDTPEDYKSARKRFGK